MSYAFAQRSVTFRIYPGQELYPKVLDRISAYGSAKAGFSHSQLCRLYSGWKREESNEFNAK